MPAHSSDSHTSVSPHHSISSQEAARSVKLPRSILPGVFAFSPHRETLGGTAYFIVEKAGNILIDTPAFDEENQQFLTQHGGVRWLFLSHRGGIGKAVKKIQEILTCDLLIQEQEAYLLPEVALTPFGTNLRLSDTVELIWTPGHSPGSSCLYWNQYGGVLFSGRHLLCDRQGQLVPLRTAKTFHWGRQLKSVQVLRDRFSVQTLHFLCPGANTGFLRGKGAIENAYEQLTTLDLEALRQTQPLL